MAEERLRKNQVDEEGKRAIVIEGVLESYTPLPTPFPTGRQLHGFFSRLFPELRERTNFYNAFPLHECGGFFVPVRGRFVCLNCGMTYFPSAVSVVVPTVSRAEGVAKDRKTIELFSGGRFRFKVVTKNRRLPRILEKVRHVGVGWRSKVTQLELKEFEVKPLKPVEWRGEELRLMFVSDAYLGKDVLWQIKKVGRFWGEGKKRSYKDVKIDVIEEEVIRRGDVVRAGSVVRLVVSEAPDEFYEDLGLVLVVGLGKRQSSGFGEVVVVTDDTRLWT